MKPASKLFFLIRRCLGILRTVWHRLNNWRKVALNLKGETLNDQAVLLSAIARSPITVWQNLDIYQFPSTERDCTVISSRGSIFYVRANSDDLFHALPNQEPAVEKAICKHLGGGSVFIDAGSNIGYYSILASKIVGDNGAVDACEMLPSTIAVLRKNLSRNNCNNVSLIEGALSLREGDLVRACLPKGKYGSASITRHQSEEYIEVRTKTLASIAREHKYIDCIKMDLEGAEFAALQGLGSEIRKVNSIVFEDNQDQDLVHLLISAGFSIKAIDARNSIAVRIQNVLE